MKRLVPLLLLLLIPIQAKAIICSNEKKVQFQTLASNITTSYTYVEQDNNITFQITLSNIPEGFIIQDIKNNQTYSYQGSELTIFNLKPDKSYRFDVYTDDVDCSLVTLYSHYVTTPPYNPYYHASVCVGMEQYPLCQMFTKITYTYEEFVQKVNALKQTLEQPIVEDEPKPESEKSIYDYILEFYLNYYYIVLPLFIVSGIIIIYRYNKKNDLF